MKITVLGAGSWGSTVASIAAWNRNETTLWARNADTVSEINESRSNNAYLPGFTLPKRLRASSDLAESIASADVVVVGVPSQSFREVLVSASASIRPWIPVVSLTKGFEKGSMLRMTEVIKEVLPGHPAAALTGPNLAKEVMSGLAAAGVIATEDQAVAAALQDVFHRDVFRLYTNHDVVGCEVGGALKNVIAIATGMAEGLSVGDNTRAAVMSRGLAELTRLGVAMGGLPSTFAGLAGLGDLIATCSSPQSRNRYVGERLGKGDRLADILADMKMVAEGVKTAEIVLYLGERYGVRMPICEQIHRVVTGAATAIDAYAGLMQEKPGHEDAPD